MGKTTCQTSTILLLIVCLMAIMALSGCATSGYQNFGMEPLDEKDKLNTDNYGCAYKFDSDCLRHSYEWTRSSNREISVTYYNRCQMRIVAEVCQTLYAGGEDCEMLKLERGYKYTKTTPQADGGYSAKFFGSEDAENDNLCGLRSPGFWYKPTE